MPPAFAITEQVTRITPGTGTGNSEGLSQSAEPRRTLPETGSPAQQRSDFAPRAKSGAEFILSVTN